MSPSGAAPRRAPAVGDSERDLGSEVASLVTPHFASPVNRATSASPSEFGSSQFRAVCPRAPLSPGRYVRDTRRGTARVAARSGSSAIAARMRSRSSGGKPSSTGPPRLRGQLELARQEIGIERLGAPHPDHIDGQVAGDREQPGRYLPPTWVEGAGGLQARTKVSWATSSAMRSSRTIVSTNP